MRHLPPEIIDAGLLILGYVCRWIIDKFSKKGKRVVQLQKENDILHSYLKKQNEQKRQS